MASDLQSPFVNRQINHAEFQVTQIQEVVYEIERKKLIVENRCDYSHIGFDVRGTGDALLFLSFNTV